MSGADKFPFSHQFHADFRYFGHSSSHHPTPQTAPAPTAAATVAPPPHPFIAHFYPMLAGAECPNPGYPNAINPTPQSSAAALVALAGQNFSSQLLQNFQLKAFRDQLAVTEDCSTENKVQSPAKKNRQPFDVESLTCKSPPQDFPVNRNPVNDSTSQFPEVFSVNPSPIHSAWQQLLRRFRGNESPPDSSDQPLPYHGGYQHRDSQRSFYRLRESGFPRDSMEMTPLHEQQKRKRSDFQLKQKSPKQNLHNDSNPVDFTCRSSSPQPNTTHSGTSHPAIDHVDIMSTSPIGSNSSRDNLTDYDAMLLSNRNTSSVSSIQSQEDAPRRRKKRSSSVSDLCPVCGLTVRESDLAAHLQMEIEKLSKLPSDLRRKAFCHRRSSIERKFSFGATSSSNATSTSSKRLADRDLSPKSERDNREKTFRKVRSNRLERLNSRVGSCLRAQRGTDGNSPSHRVWIGHSGALMCPVCSRAIQGGSAEISAHVGECLRQRRQSPQLHEDEDVDVENDMTQGITSQEDTRSNQSFGSDEWRTDARSSNLGVAGSIPNPTAFSPSRNTQQSEPVLNVETDDTFLFGSPQFSEADIASSSVTSQEARLPSAESPGNSPCLTPPSTGEEESCSTDVAVLHTKIKKLINEKRSNRCQICMDSYEDPLASIECWHVHCRKCWLRALSVKKLCPQCSAITPADKLRRIYL